jgi:hypothetical protein
MSVRDDQRLKAAWMSSAMEQDRYSVLDQDVSKETRAPWRKLNRYLHEKLELGASVESLTDFLAEMQGRVRAWAGAVASLPLAVAHRRAIMAEAASNVAQTLATMNPTTANLEKAVRDVKVEIARNEEWLASAQHELMRRMNGAAPSVTLNRPVAS